MNIKKIVFFAFLFLQIPKVFAIDVGEATIFVEPDQDRVGHEIVNNFDETQFISVNIQKITSPYDDGKVIAPDSPNELLTAPASKVVEANSHEIFRFYYNGPKDDKERYYRVIWKQSPLTLQNNKTSAKTSIIASKEISVSTILVVRPKKEIKWDAKIVDGSSILNTGNTSLKIVAYGTCTKNNKKQCKELGFVMPNNRYKVNTVDLKNKESVVGAWENGNFVHIE